MGTEHLVTDADAWLMRQAVRDDALALDRFPDRHAIALLDTREALLEALSHLLLEGDYRHPIVVDAWNADALALLHRLRGEA